MNRVAHFLEISLKVKFTAVWTDTKIMTGKVPYMNVLILMN